MNIDDFQQLIHQKGDQLYRDMPWRRDTRPYYILVSEVMLQQTQVARVIPKFQAFIDRFPDVEALARAPLAEVLTLWSGLGYNRRAKFLHQAAQKVVSDFGGELPTTLKQLTSLPGVGPNTAGAILAYSFNQPVVFVETNIRTVYFHHFFADQTNVSDHDLRTLVAETLDQEHPREWYWALMDYGAFLKQQGSGRLDQSRHYKKQVPLKGSLREVRGLIMKALTAGDMTMKELQRQVPPDERLQLALAGLQKDQLIEKTAGRWHLIR